MAQIERVLAGKPKAVAELCERIFPTVRPMDLYLAYSEVLGFLLYLEDLKRVERLPGRLRERWALVTAGPQHRGASRWLGLTPAVTREGGKSDSLVAGA